ncbi:hypothetical protein QR680_003554 [Steinernema hermaphroditum]|uniref:Uncharacterized protein n=1 Tax=Steinernema hermaphroditum TaxID=289476 RepID=A0AA39LRR6_9BILA|nr:hypothetical protein QR680_003554 [Steinernema hermaphroditum]
MTQSGTESTASRSVDRSSRYSLDYKEQSDFATTTYSDDSAQYSAACYRKLSRDKARIVALIADVDAYLHKARGILENGSSTNSDSSWDTDDLSSSLRVEFPSERSSILESHGRNKGGASVNAGSVGIVTEIECSSQLSSSVENQDAESCCSMCSGGCHPVDTDILSCHKASQAHSTILDRWAISEVEYYNSGSISLHTDLSQQETKPPTVPNNTEVTQPSISVINLEGPSDSLTSFASALSMSMSFYDRMPVNQTKASASGKDDCFYGRLKEMGFREETEDTQIGSAPGSCVSDASTTYISSGSESSSSCTSSDDSSDSTSTDSSTSGDSSYSELTSSEDSSSSCIEL